MAKVNKGKVIMYVLIVLLVILVLGFIAFFTKGFTTGFKTFYVKIKDDTLMENKAEFQMIIGNDYSVEVCYTFDFLSKEKELGYHVKVMPFVTDETDFDFMVDGRPQKYGVITDLTSGFDFQYSTNGFTIKTNNTLKDILQTVYPNKTLTEVPEPDKDTDYFVLIISSEDYSKSIDISFRITGLTITLDPGNIVV